MKNFYQSLVLSFFLIFLIIPQIFAQITIESSEYSITFGQELNFYTVEDTGTGIPVNVGTTGGPQNWVFNQTMFPNGQPFSYTVVDPATTPFAGDFTDSDHAWYLQDTVSTDTAGVDTFEIYIYFNLTNEALLILGDGIISQDSTFTSVPEPEEIALTFPATLNTSWTNNYATRSDFGEGILSVDSTYSEAVIDAWGTVELPGGTLNCLRIREDVTDIYTTLFNGVPLFSDTSRSIVYTWVTENQGLLATIESLDNETDPNFTVASNVQFRVDSPTSIREDDPRITEGFRLYQNFPNPFNPVTTISFDMAATGTASLKVFNILGEEVATLLNNELAPGYYEVQWNAADVSGGIYFYRLEIPDETGSAARYSATKKLVLMK